MCLLIALHKVVEDTPLFVAANRDEQLARPAVAMTVLQEAEPRILGGRDLLANGTWLAANEHGVVAALTNMPGAAYRDPARRSRGELPLLLAQHASAEAATQALLSQVDPADYNPCWLLVGDRDSLFYVEIQMGVPLQPQRLPPGIHVLENHPLHPVSTKAAFIRSRVEQALEQTPESGALQTALYKILGSHDLPPGVGNSDGSVYNPLATKLYAACVHSTSYGTRSAALVQVPAAKTARPHLVFAEGPPCTQPLQSADALWQTAAAAAIDSAPLPGQTEGGAG